MKKQRMIRGKNIFEQVVKETAEQLQQPVSIVETVLMDQFKQAFKATHEVAEIEFSGFGNLKISASKLRKRIQKHETYRNAYIRELQGDPENLTLMKKLHQVDKDLEHFYARHHEIQTNTGGIQKQPVSSGTP